MNLKERKKRIEALLKAAGLERLCPITQTNLINDIEIWTARLQSGSGSAKAEVRVFHFGEQPGLIVDYQEEKESLQAEKRRVAAWGGAQVLIHADRTSEIGILVTCRASDEHLFREMPPPFEVGRYTYHPQLERVLGGDYFREIKGYPAKACVMSLKHAQEMHPLLGELAEAYGRAPAWQGKLDYPFPATLAVLSLSGPGIDAPNVPAEYQELALLITVITGVEVVIDLPPAGTRNREACTSQLFRGMKIAHANRFTFSRGGICNYVPEFVTPAGALNDAYFLWRDLDLKRPEELWQSQETDLINGLLTVAGFADEDAAARCQTLLQGVREYMAPGTARDDMVELVREADEAERDFVGHVKRVAAAVLAATADF